MLTSVAIRHHHGQHSGMDIRDLHPALHGMYTADSTHSLIDLENMLETDCRLQNICINQQAHNVHLQQYYQHLLLCHNSSTHFKA